MEGLCLRDASFLGAAREFGEALFFGELGLLGASCGIGEAGLFCQSSLFDLTCLLRAAHGIRAATLDLEADLFCVASFLGKAGLFREAGFL
ncbi:hypothetical protein WA016_01147 [Myxococcus stipitatus]